MGKKNCSIKEHEVPFLPETTGPDSGILKMLRDPMTPVRGKNLFPEADLDMGISISLALLV